MSAMHDKNKAILKIDGLDIAHTRLALRDWSATICAGVTLVFDEEGECKTDFLRLLAGELSYAKGKLCLLGIEHCVDASAYKQQVFWITPSAQDFDALTVEAFFALQARRYSGFDQMTLAQMIAGLALEPHLFKQIHMLSTGTRRKVWIAAALASEAELTLLDDPLAALDKSSAMFVLSQIAALAQAGQRALVLGDYQAPADMPLIAKIDLGVINNV